MHNIALKSIRDSHEDPPGFPKPSVPKWGVNLFEHDPYPVHQLVKGEKTDYTLVEPKVDWSWKKCSGP